MITFNNKSNQKLRKKHNPLNISNKIVLLICILGLSIIFSSPLIGSPNNIPNSEIRESKNTALSKISNGFGINLTIAISNNADFVACACTSGGDGSI